MPRPRGNMKRGPALRGFLRAWEALSDVEIQHLASFNKNEWETANPSDSALMAMELLARRLDDKLSANANP